MSQRRSKVGAKACFKISLRATNFIPMGQKFNTLGQKHVN